MIMYVEMQLRRKFKEMSAALANTIITHNEPIIYTMCCSLRQLKWWYIGVNQSIILKLPHIATQQNQFKF